MIRISDCLKTEPKFFSEYSCDKKDNILLSGFVQSGKTNEMLFYCWWSIFVANRSVVFLTRNITADVLQLKDRINTFNKKFVLRPEYNLTDKKLIIGMCNHIQIKNICEITERLPYNLCIDEYDYSIKSRNNTSELEKYLAVLEERCRHQLGATATGFAVVSAKKITKILQIPVPDNYYGIDDLNVMYVPDVNPIKYNMDWKIEDDVNLRIVYDSFMYKKEGIILHNVTKFKKMHHKLMMSLVKKYNGLCVVVYNGDGILVATQTPPNPNPTPPNTNPPNPNPTTTNPTKLMKNKKVYSCSFNGSIAIHRFTKSIMINNVIDILKAFNYSHISIISGNLASRGVSFVSSDYKYHLTDQYFVPASNSHGETLLQGMRIFGCYNDEPELTLWCSKKDWRKIVDQNDILNKYIKDITASKSEEDAKRICLYKPIAKFTRNKLMNGLIYKYKDNGLFNIVVHHPPPENPKNPENPENP